MLFIKFIITYFNCCLQLLVPYFLLVTDLELRTSLAKNNFFFTNKNVIVFFRRILK